jgi:hypothetical protein
MAMLLRTNVRTARLPIHEKSKIPAIEQQSKPSTIIMKPTATFTSAFFCSAIPCLLALHSLPASAQEIDGSNGVNLGNTGTIYNLPPITFPSDPVLWPDGWEAPGLQAYGLPASQFTGITTTGASLDPRALLPYRAQSLAVIDTSGAVSIALTAGTLPGDAGWIHFYNPDTEELEPLISLDSDGNLIVRNERVLTIDNGPTLLGTDFVIRTSKNGGSPDSLLMEGTFGGSDPIPTSGPGTRMMWYPEKAAFRAGRVSGNQWNSVGTHSVAMGYNSKASANNSFAMGTECQSEGAYSIAMGSSSASGDNSVAIGMGSYACGPGDLALGPMATVDGVHSIAISEGNASSYHSFAAMIGEAYGGLSIAFSTAVAHGDSSVAIGGYDWSQGNWPGNESYGDNATTIGGVGNKADGFSSFSSGFWTKAASGYSVAIGSLNHGQGTGGDTWIDTDPLFELGNGIAPRSGEEPPSSSRSNAITTLKNGQTALINKAWKVATTAAPSDPAPHLADYGASQSGGNALVVDGHTVLNGKVIISVPQGDISMGIYQ